MPAHSRLSPVTEASGLHGLRLWLLLLLLVTFLGGVAAGRLWTLRNDFPPDPPGPFHDYALRLATRFELSDVRKGYLRVILDNYDLELSRLEERYRQEFSSAIEPEVRALGEEYDTYIRDHVLPPDRRADFDPVALSLPHPEPRDD